MKEIASAELLESSGSDQRALAAIRVRAEESEDYDVGRSIDARSGVLPSAIPS